MTAPILSMGGQAMTFGLAVLAGAAIALAYDGLRVFRRLVPHATWVVNVQDIVFWLAATVSFFVFLHTYSGGVRPFAVVGAVCGAALYFATASPFVVRFFVWLIQLLIAPFTAAFRFLHRLVRKPLRIAARYATIHKKRLAQQLHILRRKV